MKPNWPAHEMIEWVDPLPFRVRLGWSYDPVTGSRLLLGRISLAERMGRLMEEEAA